jgi:3-deoxy-7-phosphoheptulonate synthase
VLKPYKRASREFAVDRTVVRIGERASIGGHALTVIAGPCSVENRDMLHETAVVVRDAGATILRGGAFKPRSSPYSFQGLGREALRILVEVRSATGLPVVTEVLDTRDVDLVAEHADMLQVGARNMQNFALLAELGRVQRPVLLKRGMSATITELLMAAEYIMAHGNSAVVLCERGIRTFERATRNTLDVSAIPVLKRETHLPVIVDPSHAAGRRRWVPALAQAALGVGAEGLLVEVHVEPESAWSDSEQAIDVDTCRSLVAEMRRASAARTTPESVEEGRELIDALDEEILRLVRARREVSCAIQALRLNEGGGRLDPAREATVTHAYRSTLGPDGEALAYNLLTLCRGEAR